MIDVARLQASSIERRGHDLAPELQRHTDPRVVGFLEGIEGGVLGYR